MAGMLCVPASRRSGRNSGMAWLRLSEPVPPAMRGRPFSRQSSTPVPWGPSRPLWPGIQMNSAPSRAMSTSIRPADCEASTISGTPSSRQSAAISYMGSTKPKTFETWVQTTALAPGIFSLNAATAASVLKRGEAATSILAPMRCSGRVTALCSQPETTTRSPLLTRLNMAMLSACVAFMVNTTFSGPGAEKRSASRARQS